MFNKKRKLIFLQCVLIFLCSCMCFTACKFGKKPDSTEHIHSFEENVKDDFLITEATCIQRALYYKSCVCGELSDQTFECGELAPHDFSGENPDESFLKQSATCTQKALYYKSCTLCGAKGNDVFEYGFLTEHTFGEWIEEVPATCQTNGIKGHYICSECKNAFNEYSELIEDLVISADHTYSDKLSFNDTHHWNAALCGCSAKQNYAEHILGEDGCCTVCKTPVSNTQGVVYALSQNGDYAEVIGYTGSAEKVKIASTYSGLPVKVIRENAFKDSNITFIVIPSGVTQICDYAFNDCSSIKNISLPSTLINFGENVFCVDRWDVDYTEYEGCYYVGNEKNPYLCLVKSNKQIEFLTINKKTKFINSSALRGVGLKEIVIPDGVLSIGEEAFYGCLEVTKVVIPDSVVKIGDSAFDYCVALIDLSIGKGVKTIGEQVFENSDIQTLKTPVAAINHLYSKYHLKQVEIVGGGTIPSQAFVNCENLTKVTMSDQITGIDVWAFYDCSSLNDITFSKNISSIGEGAFWHCSKLTNVILGENIMSIGARAFADCPNLLFGEHNNVNYLGTKNNPYLYLIGAKDSNITSCEIHPYTIIIAEDAFSRCSSLKELVLPSGLAVIGELSFDDCTALKTVSYRGTASEWYAISKKQDCFSKTQVTQVQCSDQTIDI